MKYNLAKTIGRPCKKTVPQIVKEFFPKATKEEINHIIWNETGFPGFWNIPEDGKTTLQCFRKQLKEFKDKCKKEQRNVLAVKRQR